MVHVAGGGCAHQGGAELGSASGKFGSRDTATNLCASPLTARMTDVVTQPTALALCVLGPCTARAFASRLCLTVKL